MSRTVTDKAYVAVRVLDARAHRTEAVVLAGSPACDELPDWVVGLLGEQQPAGFACVDTPVGLYVSTGYELGALYAAANLPDRIGVDNHNYFSALTWTATADGVRATGTLNENLCVPNCAGGTYVTHPVEITATEPARCAVDVYTSGVAQQVEALVYTRIRVRALSGAPEPYLVGDGVLGAPCRT